MIFDPFISIMFMVSAIGLLVVVYVARCNMTARLEFHNSSYQLGMIFATVCWMFVSGFLGVTAWLLG